jgi:hypothetical protein
MAAKEHKERIGKRVCCVLPKAKSFSHWVKTKGAETRQQTGFFVFYALQYVRIFAAREDFGARAVPARSTPARSETSRFPHDLLTANPLRPGTGRAPLWLRLCRAAFSRGYFNCGI